MIGAQASDLQKERIKRLGLSERQVDLNRYWAYYCTTQHETKTITWDGRKAMTQIEKETISRSTVMPPGFYDGGGQYDELPLDMRIPTAPYHLVRVVVHRFTGLLFASKKHPTISVAGNPELQTWIETLIKTARLWIRFALARNFGGGMGSVAMSFRFRNGKPMIDVHDTRWCTPTFVDISTGEISALEIRYTFPQERRDERGVLKQVWFWYRRVIDAEKDIVFRPAEVGDGDEPTWIPATVSEHGFGECPAVWIRNTQTDEMDGDPDCMGEFAAQDAIDRLLSQADQGAVENADPTLGIDSDELKVEQIKKGSRNAIKTEKGAGIKYVEMTGSGIDSALKVADVHRRNFLEVVRCVLETEQSDGAMTATEVERRYSPMHECGDLLREQYGEHGIVPLIGKIVRATLKMGTIGASPKFDDRSGLRIVPKVMPGRAELPAGLDKFTDDAINLEWPAWVERGATEAQAAAGAVATARSAQVLDRESALNYLAPYFGIKDVAAALARAADEQGATDDTMMQGLQAAGQQPNPNAPHPTAGPAPGEVPSASPAHAPPTAPAAAGPAIARPPAA